MITRYGYDVVMVVMGVAVLGSLMSFLFIDWKPLKFGLPGLFLLLLIFTLNFFRDPDRSVPAGENLVLAPADGKVILIRQMQDEEYLKGEATQVSIFMSPLDVHVNRFPITGTVGYFRYIPGDYFAAFEEKASLRNEQTHIGVESNRVKVLFKQIAGFVARRIVAEVRVGDHAVAGTRFGMIKFGSRVDVIVPRTFELKVKTGDRTVAGETVLAVRA